MGPMGQHSDRRQMLIALGTCALGAAVVIAVAGRTWADVRLDLPAPLPSSTVSLTGRQLHGLPFALGIAGLAGALAVIATRGVARIVVGALQVVFGAAIGAASIAAIGSAHVLATAAAGSRTGQVGAGAATVYPWWVGSVIGGALLVAGGVVVALRGRRWPGMSSRYDAPGARRERRGDPDATLWDTIERGEDPTVDPAEPDAPPPDTAPPELSRPGGPPHDARSPEQEH